MSELVRARVEERLPKLRLGAVMPRGKVAAQTIERRQHRELLVDEPRQPVARDLRAVVRRGERSWGRAPTTVATATARAPHDAAPLVFLDDVQLLSVRTSATSSARPPQ